jgi:hypothetical protein
VLSVARCSHSQTRVRTSHCLCVDDRFHGYLPNGSECAIHVRKWIVPRVELSGGYDSDSDPDSDQHGNEHPDAESERNPNDHSDFHSDFDSDGDAYDYTDSNADRYFYDDANGYSN